MLRRVVAIVTLVSMLAALPALPGCYSHHELTPMGVTEDPTYRIQSLVTNDGRSIYFETKARRAFVMDDEIVGFAITGEPVRIPLADVRAVKVVKHHEARTTLTVVTVSAVALTLVWFAWQSSVNEAWEDGHAAACGSSSCPLIYSFDGSNFVFDAEPYGNAICEALKRTDLCELQELRPIDGEYRLLISNELDETQFNDQVELVVVDHEPGVRVLPDERGGLHTIAAPVPPTSARDAAGEDWLKWLAGNDGLFWETDILSVDPERTADLRDTLVLSFSRPPGATGGRLVVSGRNTVYSSRTLRRGTALRGERVGEWYEELKSPETRKRVNDVFVREEVNFLKVRVRANGAWETRGLFNGSPPLVFEEFVVPLDLSGVEGDEVEIMLAPPAGFWELNSFAMDYGSNTELDRTVVAPKRAVSDDGRDVMPLIAETDAAYLVMEDVGMSAEVAFDVPPERLGRERTVFARASGYYEMHLDAEGPSDEETLARLEHEPDFIVRFALEGYHEQRAALLAANAGVGPGDSR
jgi:hypothetical protein